MRCRQRSILAATLLAVAALVLAGGCGSKRGATASVSGVVLVDNRGGIVAANVDGSGVRVLLRRPFATHDSKPVAAADGSEIAFLREARSASLIRVMVVRADGTGLRTVGQTGGGAVEWSPDARWLAYGDDRLTVVRPDGSDRRVLASAPGGFAWSPDGEELAYADEDSAISIVNVGSGERQRLYRGGTRPAWSPDGSRIAFVAGDENRVVVMERDGTDAHGIGPPIDEGDTPAWSPESTRLAYGWSDSDWGPNGPSKEAASLVVVEVSSGRVVARIPARGRAESVGPASWSPTGDRIAFERFWSDENEETGDLDVWISRPNGTGVVQVTDRFPFGGSWSAPRWLPGVAAVRPHPPPAAADLTPITSRRLRLNWRIAAADTTSVALRADSSRSQAIGIWGGKGRVSWIRPRRGPVIADIALSGRRLYWSDFEEPDDPASSTSYSLWTATWPAGRPVRIHRSRAASAPLLAGNRSLVVYTLGKSLQRLQGTNLRALRRENTDLSPLSVSGERVLIANGHRRLEVIDSSGRIVASLRQPPAMDRNWGDSAYLSGNRLIVLSGSATPRPTVRVLRLPSRKLRSTRTIRPFDFDDYPLFDDAVASPHGSFFAYRVDTQWRLLDLGTGRDKVILVNGVSPTSVAITNAGLFYTTVRGYAGADGKVGLVPLRTVRAAMR